MNTKEKLEAALHDAMRSGNDLVKRTVRMALSNIKFQEKENGNPINEAAVLAILQKEIKSRRETIVEAEKGHRSDIIEATKAEIDVLSTFLPEQMPDEKIREIAEIVIKEINAQSMSDMGKVMKELLPRVEGRASNDKISQVVRQLLSK